MPTGIPRSSTRPPDPCACPKVSRNPSPRSWTPSGTVPLGVHERGEGFLETFGHAHGSGGRVEDRGMPVGIGEGLGDRAGSKPVHLAEDAACGLLVHVGIRL